MGALIRAMDWSKTPIGPMERWSQTLRAMLSFLLVNRFPLLLWWGPEFCQLYNDAYRPVLGAKHPKSMGQPARECWPEIWHIIGPLIETPFNGGPATWMEDLPLVLNRYGFAEETHFTVAYSPVPDEAAPHGIGGVLATVHEITEKVIGERRIVMLRDLGAPGAPARSAEEACAISMGALANHAEDVPFALLYLIDADGRKASLAGTVGIEPGKKASPLAVSLDARATDTPWPLVEALQREKVVVVEDLAGRFPSVPPGPWSDPPHSAVIVPVHSNKTHQLAALLVAGISPRLRLDDNYIGFFELLAAQVATTIANTRAYEEERKRAEALAAIDRAKTAFFSNVSHEFRTPLTLMLAPLEDLLGESAKEGGKNRALLEVAHRNGLRLLRLVNTLLDFSRIEAGRVEASYEPTDLAALTAELVSNFRSACEKAGLHLTVDCPPLAELVYVDRDMWEKIVLNLVSNAFKYTLAGGIEVRLCVAGGAAVLSVVDTGCGIPEDEIPRLFERFHRVEGASGRTHEGTGIGLALVQELVKLHGGTVQVESAYGSGSRFTVSIPLGKAHLPADRIRSERTRSSTALGPRSFVEEALRWLPDAPVSAIEEAEFDPALLGGQPGERPANSERAVILVADDNADMREYVRRLLSARYDVEAVTNGLAALTVLRQGRRPDLLLSDVMMPQLDGLGLLRVVRADPALADLPVILLSARAGEEASIVGLETGADDYLVKPFSARELLARVAANIKLSQLRREFERRTAFDLRSMTCLHELGNLCAQREIDFNECLNEILDAAIALTGADKGNIQLFDPKSESLTIAAQRGFEKPFLDFFADVRVGEAAACGAAMAAASRILVEDVVESAIFAGQDLLDVLLQAGVRAVQSTPLTSSSGSVVGVISTHFSRPHRPSEQELRFMDLLARQAADFLERKQADAALHELNDTLERKIEERTRALESEMAERQRIEAALQQAQRLEVIGQVTGGVAHDFNNLLMIVGGNLELLKHRRGDAQKVIARIEQAVARGENLVRQLLSFSRRQSLRPEVLDLSSWTPKLIELLRSSLRGDIDIAAEVADDIWPVEADPGELELALLNIAVNARDAMPRGGRITVGIRNIRMDGQSTDGLSGDFVRIAVSDTGVGIPAHLLHKVFDPFFTTKEVGKGTGLGLSQVHGFAKQAGGTALIESRVGKGTTVALFLPRARTSLLPSELETVVQFADRASGSILLVEDNDDVAEATAEMLAGLGYGVVRVSSAGQALNYLEGGGNPDLLLSDIVMPGGTNGVDLARIVRKRYPKLPILLSTGYSAAAREASKERLTILPKPYRLATLERFIRATLEREQHDQV